MNELEKATHALHRLEDAVDMLAASVLPGTAPPYRAPHLTLEAREQRDAQAREERHQRVNIAPGDSPDPYRLDVAELMSHTVGLADALSHWTVLAARLGALTHRDQQWPVLPLPDAAHSFTDPRPYLRYTAAWLPVAELAEPDLPRKIRRKAEQYIARADTLLGHVHDGQVFPALCFSCGGRDDEHPVGGAHTLRVRTRHAGHGLKEPCTAEGADCRTLIVCEGGHCEPEECDFGQRHRGHPAWDWDNESKWLLSELGVKDKRDEKPPACRCGAVLPPRNKYCSAACRVAAHRERAKAA